MDLWCRASHVTLEHDCTPRNTGTRGGGEVCMLAGWLCLTWPGFARPFFHLFSLFSLLPRLLLAVLLAFLLPVWRVPLLTYKAGSPANLYQFHPRNPLFVWGVLLVDSVRGGDCSSAQGCHCGFAWRTLGIQTWSKRPVAPRRSRCGFDLP